MDKIEFKSFEINISKKDLAYIHSHPLLAEFEEDKWIKNSIMVKDDTEIRPFKFGGVFRRQFRCVTEIASFKKAFNKLLIDNKIPSKHCGSLLYLITFLETYYDENSKSNNLERHLKETGNFLLDLCQIDITTIKDEEERFRYLYIDKNENISKSPPQLPHPDFIEYETDQQLWGNLKQQLIFFLMPKI